MEKNRERKKSSLSLDISKLFDLNYIGYKNEIENKKKAQSQRIQKIKKK